MQIENVSSNCQKMLVRSPNGTVTEMMITQTEKLIEMTVNGIKTEIDISAMKSAKTSPTIDTPTYPLNATQPRGQTIDEIISELTKSSPNTGTLPVSDVSIPSTSSISAASTTLSNFNPPMVLDGFDPNHIAYSWYGKAFVDGTNFPHNDKVYYGIDVQDDWTQTSNNIIDFMLNQYSSDNMPEFILSNTLGAIMASLIVEAIIPIVGWVALIAEILAIIIADVIALIIWSVTKNAIIDEDRNMWFWLGTGFLNFLAYSYLPQHASDDWENPLTWPSHISAILSGFWSSAYLKVGSITFANNIGILEAIAPQYYGNTVQSTYAWQTGTAYVSNSGGILGQSPNGNFAELHAANSNDMAYIVTSLNTAGGGKVYVNAYSNSDNSQMRVYVSSDNSNWYLMPYGERTINSDSAEYYDCGSAADAHYGYTTNYVMVLAWNPGGSPSDLRVDCVQLINNPQITVRSYGFIPFPYPSYVEISGVTVYCTTSGTTPTTVRGEDGTHTIGIDNYAQGGHLDCFFDPYSNTYYYYFAVVSGVAFLTLNMNHDMTLCALYVQ